MKLTSGVLEGSSCGRPLYVVLLLQLQDLDPVGFCSTLRRLNSQCTVLGPM